MLAIKQPSMSRNFAILHIAVLMKWWALFWKSVRKTSQMLMPLSLQWMTSIQFLWFLVPVILFDILNLLFLFGYMEFRMKFNLVIISFDHFYTRCTFDNWDHFCLHVCIQYAISVWRCNYWEYAETHLQNNQNLMQLPTTTCSNAYKMYAYYNLFIGLCFVTTGRGHLCWKTLDADHQSPINCQVKGLPFVKEILCNYQDHVDVCICM